MEIYMRNNDLYVKVINGVSVVYVHKKEDASEFSDMNIIQLISLKERLEKREEKTLEMEYVAWKE